VIALGLICAALVFSLGCSLPWRAPKLGPSVEVPPPETRFLVLPVNALVPTAPEFSGSTGRVLDRVMSYLAAHGYERDFIDEVDTRRLWKHSVAQVDVSERRPKDFRSAIRVFNTELARTDAYDALVVASLVYRQASLARGFVKWDGTARRLPKPGEGDAVPESYVAAISAISLHVMVFDAAGELVFENYGGIDLAHSFAKMAGPDGGLKATSRESILGRRRFLNEGVETAFDPYLPRPRSSQW
jgi:hypothetical protein